MRFILILLLIPILGIAQQKYLYQYHDFRNGNQKMSLNFQKQEIHYPNKIPFTNKSANVNPINLGYGFSNSMYDKNMSGAYDVIQTDSFYYIAGRTRIGTSSLANNELMFSMKIDLQGNVVWKRTDSLMDANHWDIYYGHTLAQLDNGDFVQIAFYPNYDTIKKFNFVYPLIRRFDNNGSSISRLIMNYDSIPNWNDSSTFLPYGGVFAGKDSNIVLFGDLTSKTWIWKNDINSYIYDSIYIGMIILDKNYCLIKCKKFSNPDFGHSIIIYDANKTSDNGYLLSFNSYQFKKDFILKLDSNFNYEWHKKLGDSILYHWTAQRDGYSCR